MAYCSLTDLENALQEDDLVVLTDDAGAGTVNETVVNAAIADADALIDGYLSGRYATPLATVPGLIKKFSVDLTIYNLYDRKKFLAIPEQLNKTRDNTVALLEKIRKGEVLIGLSPSTSQPSSLDFITNKTSADRLWSSEVLDRMP